MTESDIDIYAKLTEGDGGVTIDPNADPLDRGTPGSMEPETVVPSMDGLRDQTWTHAWVEYGRNEQVTSIFIVTDDIESARNGNGELVLDGARVIAEDQRVFGEDSPLRVHSFQPVDFETVFENVNNADLNRIEPNHYSLDLTINPIARDDQFDPTTDGPHWSDIDDESSWFVVRDARPNREEHHNYETYFPEEALQFRDHRSLIDYSRPPVLLDNDHCITNGHTFTNEFGIIATECYRVTPEQVPAPDAEMQSVREQACADLVDDDDGELFEVDDTPTGTIELNGFPQVQENIEWTPLEDRITDVNEDVQVELEDILSELQNNE